MNVGPSWTHFPSFDRNKNAETNKCRWFFFFSFSVFFVTGVWRGRLGFPRRLGRKLISNVPMDSIDSFLRRTPKHEEKRDKSTKYNYVTFCILFLQSSYSFVVCSSYLSPKYALLSLQFLYPCPIRFSGSLASLSYHD